MVVVVVVNVVIEQADQSEMRLRQIAADDEATIDALRIKLDEEQQRRAVFLLLICIRSHFKCQKCG